VIFDAEDREDGWFRDQVFDVCVVGAGPAGITLARALARRSRKVCLLEGGGTEFSEESQELYAGDVVGYNYVPLDVTRLRYLGGTSNHWSGWSRPLDAWDFAPHAANPRSGWPITKTDLDVYARETDEILDLKRFSQSARYFKGHKISPFVPVDFRWSAPTRFGTKYAEELEKESRVRLYLHANLVDIPLDEARRSVSELKFRSFKREGEFAVRAKYYVLCLGGIENARALLNSQRFDRHSIGDQYGLVGRYFTEHLHFALGAVLYKTLPPRRIFLGPKPTFMDSTGTLNFGLRLYAPPKRPASLLRDIGCSMSFIRKLARAIGAPLDCIPLGRLGIAAEQALNYESCVRLTDKVDRFGLQRVVLDWRLSDTDNRTIRNAATKCARLFAKRDLGRVKLADWVVDPAGEFPGLGKAEVLGNHHMCTTRMSAEAKSGVVDKDCRLHDVENLYLGGSSVFATAGHSNPTYTIVQLALRLADHLNDHLG
jgi:choline dehydrogenase-like flavoprotein